MTRKDYIDQLRKFVDAGTRLNDIWQDLQDEHPDLGIEGYPFKHSFDEEMSLMQAWLEKQEECLSKTPSKLEAVQKILASATFNTDLDSVMERNGDIIVTFRAEAGHTSGAVVMYVDLESKTYSIGSSSTANTRLFDGVARTYTRALHFTKVAGLEPKVV